MFASRATLSEHARTALHEAHLAASARGLAASLRGAGQGVMQPLHDHLGSIEVPTLVIAGGLDPVGGERATAVAERLPNARLEVVPDAGHTVHLERPDVFIRIVNESLAIRGEP